MLTYSLEQRGNLPLYAYLYVCIRKDILSGVLPPDTRLPSKRALSEHLGVSVVTVETAYQQLEAEGYVYARPRRGVFVSKVERVLPAPPSAPEIPAMPVRHDRLDLTRNRISSNQFPSAAWARLTRQVLSEGGLLSPVPHQGLPELRQAIAEDLRARKGMAVSADQIIIGAGAEYLYLLLAQLLGRDTVLAVEDPGYPKIRQIYEKWGTPCRPIPLDAQGLPPERLGDAGAVHLSPSHHYPTGLMTPIARRQALLRWAEQTGSHIIEDDYDSEFRFTGRPLPTLQSIDRTGRVIYMNTFSQTISPSMRLGFMVLPPELLEQYRKELYFYSCTVSALDQHVLARFLKSGDYSRHISRMRKTYRIRRSKVLNAFRNSKFSDRMTIFEQGVGLHFLLHLDTCKSDGELRRHAESLGVRLAFLSEYAAVPKSVYDHTLVVNYAGLDEDALPETMSLLETVFSTL